MSALLELRDVVRTFGNGASATNAVDGVSFDINENEFFALLGPSGCGKTTLLRILAGLEEPDGGSITLTTADGATSDLLAMPVHRRPINLMFQSYALFPHLTVERNVAYGLRRQKDPKLSNDEIRMRVAEVLDMVGLRTLAQRRPAQLSGGQRQRVALARAVVKRPRLLLLDEPLAALDRKVRAQMQTELKRLQNEVGITFVVVTHDQEEAMSMADRVAVMNAGRIEQLASPTELYQRPASRFVADFIGATNLFDGQIADGGLRLPSGVVVAAPDLSGRTGPAAVSVRPESVRLDSPDDAPAGSLSGVVRDVQFFGGISHLLVDVVGIDQPVISSLVGASPRGPGDAVAVWWSHGDGVIVEPLQLARDTRVDAGDDRVDAGDAEPDPESAGAPR